MPTSVIAVCIPIARAMHPMTTRALLSLDLPKPYHLLDVVGYPVVDARNMITERALNIADESEISAPTHLLWIDDDMTFAPDAARRLLALDLPIVGGLCFARRAPYPPILLYKHEKPTPGYSYRYEYPEGLLDVDATGAAFLLVKKEVYLKIHDKFKEGPWTNISSGEDVSFCERAKAVGIQTVVDTTTKIGHVGEVTIEASWARRNRMVEVNPWYPPMEVPSGAPRATIVIPTYNQKPEFLHAAVESALAQTVPVEVIVVDDGSEPPVTDLPSAVKIIRTVHSGCFRALNSGIRAMTTDYFAWLSSDDLFYPKKIERQIRAMESTGAHASFHAYDVLFEFEEENALGRRIVMPPNWHTWEEQKRSLAHGCEINGLTILLHKSVFESVGEFDVSGEFSIVADWEFWNRVARRFMWLPIPAIHATRREHGENASTLYARDPERHQRWLEEDAKVRALFSPRCAKCSEPL